MSATPAPVTTKAAPPVGDPLPLRRRGRLLLGALGLVLIASVATTYLDVRHLELVNTLHQGIDLTYEEVVARESQGWWVWIAAGVLQVLIAPILFMSWFFRAYGNLKRLGSQEGRFGVGWTIGSWFIPVFGFIRPKSMINDLWVGSDPEPRAAKRRSIPALLGWWWAAWIVTNVVGDSSLRMFLRAETLPEQIAADQVSIASGVLLLALTVVAIVVVKSITDRQELRRERFLADPTAYAGETPSDVARERGRDSVPPLTGTINPPAPPATRPHSRPFPRIAIAFTVMVAGVVLLVLVNSITASSRSGQATPVTAWEPDPVPSQPTGPVALIPDGSLEGASLVDGCNPRRDPLLLAPRGVSVVPMALEVARDYGARTQGRFRPDIRMQTVSAGRETAEVATVPIGNSRTSPDHALIGYRDLSFQTGAYLIDMEVNGEPAILLRDTENVTIAVVEGCYLVVARAAYRTDARKVLQGLLG